MVRLGALASKLVGMARRISAIRMPRRRSMYGLKYATLRPAIAIPIVHALTANPIAPGGDAMRAAPRGKNGLGGKEVDDGEER